MNINLKEILIVWINLPSNKERSQNMTSIFNKYGLTNTLCFEAIQGHGTTVKDQVANGCAKSHSEVLKYIIKEHQPNSPVLILEDDVEITEDFKMNIEIPDEADCVYLGISHWGIFPKFAKHSKLNSPTSATKYSEDYYEISGMLSTHSILYISDKYKKASQKICEQSEWHCDVGLANNQKNFRVFATVYPFFVQGEYPNKAVTSAPLYLNENNKLRAIFHSWWVKNYYGLNTASNDAELVIIE